MSAMCKALDKVSDSEWEATVEKVEQTAERLRVLETRMAKWGGGLAVLMGIIAVIGGFLFSRTGELLDTVESNKTANLLTNQTLGETSKTLQAMNAQMAEARAERKHLAVDINTRAEDRYKKSEAQADFLEVRSWVRERDEASEKLRTLYHLQLDEQIANIKKSIEQIEQELKNHQH